MHGAAQLCRRAERGDGFRIGAAQPDVADAQFGEPSGQIVGGLPLSELFGHLQDLVGGLLVECQQRRLCTSPRRVGCRGDVELGDPAAQVDHQGAGIAHRFLGAGHVTGQHPTGTVQRGRAPDQPPGIGQAQ
ncbi:hypothetical protein SDC9_139044 [bioreactor metagenome]|uniref:Uncharacterized protein n=1 Tax=bioreactor metagenome TaxID=1076179 RepID=A0A645DQZ9_9ZZZZ